MSGPGKAQYDAMLKRMEAARKNQKFPGGYTPPRFSWAVRAAIGVGFVFEAALFILLAYVYLKVVLAMIFFGWLCGCVAIACAGRLVVFGDCPAAR